METVKLIVSIVQLIASLIIIGFSLWFMWDSVRTNWGARRAARKAREQDLLRRLS